MAPFPDPDKTITLMDRLRRLLEDPEPGLATWCEARDQAGSDLRDHLIVRLEKVGRASGRHRCLRPGCPNMNQGTLPFCSLACSEALQGTV